MKLKIDYIFKVFIVLAVLIVCAFNKIYAVDEVYYGVVEYDENGNKQLWYRIMVTPDVDTEKKLLTNYKYNTWITGSYLQTGTRVSATSSTYVTPYSIYTWEKIGEYSTGDTSHYHYGYVKYSDINDTYDLNSLTEFSDIKNWLASVGRSRVSVWVKDRGDYVYSFADKKNGTTRLSDVIYNGDTSNSAYNDNIIDIGGENLYFKLGYAYLDASYADDYAWALINYPTDNFYVKSAVTFNRERLYLYNSNATKNTASYIDGTILIEDVSLTTEQTEKLLEAIKNKKAEEIYVSSIFEFKRQVGDNTGTYYYAVSPTGVVHSRGANTAYNWTANMLGTTGTGEYSMLNGVDNKIKISSVESTERNIQINHVYVVLDKDGKAQKCTKIATQNYTTLYANGNKITTLNDVTNLSTTYLEKYIIKGNESLTNFNVKTLNNITSGNLIDEANNVLVAGTYEVTGYSKTEGDDINTLESQNNLSKNYNENKLKYSGGDISFDLGTNKDVVINVFYAVPSSDIQVINYCFTSDGKSGFYIEGNGYGEYENKDKVYPIIPNSGTFAELYNNLPKLKTINFKKSLKVPQGKYEYLGYQIGKTDEEVNIKNTNVTSTDEICSFENGNNNYSKIIFKFKEIESIEEETSDEPIEIIKTPPGKEISGVLTTMSYIGISKTCIDYISYPTIDYISYPTNAVTYDNDIYVGIKDNVKYVVSGINVKQQSINASFTINVKIVYGNDYKEWKISIPYYFSFYVIQNLVIHKYDNAIIYNTVKGYDTKGSILFAESDNTRTITPTFKTATLKLYSSVNLDISKSQLYDWDKYIKSYFSTNIKALNDKALELYPSDYDGYKEEYKTERLANYCKVKYDDSLAPKAVTNKCSLNTFISIDGNLKGDYKDIKNTGSYLITITLVDSTKFKKVAYTSTSKLISTDDLDSYREKTNASYSAWETAKKNVATCEEALDEAQEAYEAEVKAYPDKKKAYDEEYSAYVAEESAAYQEQLEEYKVAMSNLKEGETAPKAPEPPNIPYSPPPAPTDDKVKAAKAVLEKAQKAEKNAYDAYSNAFDKEVIANNYYDEIKYIQDNFWDKYKTYSNAKIAELIGLNVRFNYSSGAARLGSDEIINAAPKTTDIDLTKATAFDENDLVKETTLEAQRQVLNSKEYYTKGIGGNIGGIDNNYYSNNKYTIPIARLNGIRTLAGKAIYTTKNSEIIIGDTNTVIYDNMYYPITTVEKYVETWGRVSAYNNKMISSPDENYVLTEEEKNKVVISKFIVTTDDYTKSFGESQNNSKSFNIYTPLVVDTELSRNSDNAIVNQDISGKTNNVEVLQLNTKFTIKFNSNYASSSIKEKYTNYKSDFTERYRELYYIKFDYDVKDVSYKNASGSQVYVASVNHGTWIGPIYGDSITAMPALSSSNTADDVIYNYYVLAVAKNIDKSSNWTIQILNEYKESLDDVKNTELLNNLYNVCGYEGKSKISYYADEQKNVVIINRIYDFRVTDLKDLDWEDIFREENNISGGVNSHTGKAYYTGMYRWNLESLTKNNEIVTRSSDQLGTSVQRVLPLGAYKNSDATYVSAPKMGYRFSFDFKVTGSDNINKSATITTKFYYTSKDGNKFYEECVDGKNGIYLFYKNSSGQYVRVDSSSDTYKIQYTPNDGYRLLTDYTTNNLSSSLITIGSLRKLELKYKACTTRDNTLASITYYGEYKLPNSTIAVLVTNGKYDINKPLTDGYLGVVFDINANEVNGTTLSYSANDKSLDTEKNIAINASQWDYEGYLGISKEYINKKYSTSLKLEKGIWQIDNSTYNKIKGTVILYDLDRRASNDFN